MTTLPDEPTVYFACRELAQALAVTPSALSHAVREDHRVRSVYPVAEWAVRDDAGRVVGFDVPGEAADEIAARVPTSDPAPSLEGSTGPHLSPAPTSPGLPMSAHLSSYGALLPTRPEDYTALQTRYERLTQTQSDEAERQSKEAARLAGEVARVRLEASEERTKLAGEAIERRLAHAEETMALRTKHAEEVERLRRKHADELAELKEENARLRADVASYEAGHEPAPGTETNTLLRGLVEEYAPKFMPAAVNLAQGFAARFQTPAVAAPVGASLGETPAAPAPAPQAPAPQSPATSPDVARLVAQRLAEAAFQRGADALDAYVSHLAPLLKLPDWRAVVPHVLSDLSTRDATAVVRALRPLLEARLGDYLTMPTGEVVELAQGFGFATTEAHTQTLTGLLEAIRQAATVAPATPPPVRAARRRPPPPPSPAGPTSEPA